MLDGSLRSFRFLALVCLIREESFDKQGLIDYNFHCFRQAIQEVDEWSDDPDCHLFLFVFLGV